MKKTLQLLSLFSAIAFVTGVLIALFLTVPASGAFWNILHDHRQFFIFSVLVAGMIALVFAYVASYRVTGEVLYVTRERSNEEKRKEDYLKGEGHADYSNMLRDLENVVNGTEDKDVRVERILSLLCNGLQAGQGIIYKAEEEDSRTLLKTSSTYATVINGNKPVFEVGEGLVGLAAKERRRLDIDNVPEGYIKIFSGLGKSNPGNLVILPVEKDGKVTGVLEMAFFKSLDPAAEKILQKAVDGIGMFL